MRVIFCGSGPFAAPSLRAILAAGHEVVLTVSQPSRPAGRGGAVKPTPLAAVAQEAGLRVFECENVNAPESVETIRSAGGEVICVADFGQFVREPVRSAAPLGAFNLHGSILPELRGAAPVNWAVIRGYTSTGVTTFSLVDKMDAGPIYLQTRTDILPDERADELRIRLAEMGSQLVCRTLEMLSGGRTQGQTQDESQATLAPRLKREDGLLEWSGDANSIRNRINGVWPWPGGHAVFQRQAGGEFPVLIARATVLEGSAGEGGLLDGELLVQTGGGGRLKILEIQPAGKRLMQWRDFVNGYRPVAGDRFIPVP